MTDELRPNERLALDAWEPMTPPPGFADRVLDAVPTARRWFPYLATALACGAAAAIAMVILLPPRQPAPVDAPQVAVEPALDAMLAPLGSDAAFPIVVDASIPPLPPAEHHDVLIAGAQQVAIHDSLGKPTVKFVLTRACAGEIRVDVGMAVSTANPVPAKALPDGSAIITLWEGWFTYTARCVADNAKQSGTIRVSRDDASRRLPAVAPPKVDETTPVLWLERQATSSPDITTFRGHVAAGWSPSTDDQAIPLATDGSFATGMQISNPHLTIRLDHPKYGTHYYVRH